MKDGKKVIARVFSAYDGPVDYYLFDRMKMVDREKFETICVYIKKRSDEPNPLEEEGFKCFYISRQRYFKCFNLAAIFKIAAIFKREKVDVLHCNRHQATIYGTLASLVAKVPVVLSHVHGLNRSKSLRRKLTYKLLGRKMSAFLACSEGVRDDILTNFPSIKDSQVSVLANSVDYGRYANAVVDKDAFRSELGIGKDAFVFLAVGRFVPTKDFTTLIKAFSKVVEANPLCHLLMVGEGRDKAEICDFAKSLGVEGSVCMPGRRNDIPEVMKACDCFVMSSIAEGMPLTLLEAMASGLPCVSTSVGGIPEVINSDEVGMLVDSGDVAGLAAAMAKVRNMSEADLCELRENGRARVRDNFTHDIAVRKLTELYEAKILDSCGC
jgi:glycosyltransferase involved in cell wall biosynthesis